MACLINRNNNGKIDNVLSQHNKQESLLFNGLRDKVSDSVALLIWGATHTSTFKDMYEGTLDVNSEPIFKENEKQIWFVDKSNQPFFVQEKGSNKITLSEKPVLDAVTDILANDSPEFNWREQPLSDVTEKLLEDNGLDEMRPMFEKLYNKTKAAFAVLKTLQTELKDVTYEGGTKQRYFYGNQQLTGVAFNDDGLAQGLMNNYEHGEWDPSQDYAFNMARQKWDKQNKKPGERLEINNEFLDKDEFIEKTRSLMALGSLKGKVIHLYDEWNYASPDKRKDIQLKIEVLINEYNTLQVDPKKQKELNYLSWVKDTKSIIEERLGLSENDLVLHEVPIVSEELGIRGSIDKYIIRVDGTVTIRDTKTSETLLAQGEYLNFFKYGNMEANKLNQAKVQVMLYALALGLKDKNLRFSHLGIDMLSSLNRTGSIESDQGISRKDAADIITMLNRYFKAESKNSLSPHKDIWAKLQAHPFAIETLLNINNLNVYTSPLDIQAGFDSQGKVEFRDYRTVPDLEDALSKMQMGLGVYYNIDAHKQAALEAGKNSKLQKWLDDADKGLMTFVSIWSDKGMDPSVWHKDLSSMNMWLGGTVSNVRHPLVTAFNEFREGQMLKKTKEHTENIDGFMVRFMPVLNTWMKAMGKSEFKTPIDHIGFLTFLKKDALLGDKITEFWEKEFYKSVTIDGVTELEQKTAAELRSEGKITHADLQDFLQNKYDTYLAKDINGRKNPNAYIYKDATYILDKYGRPESINHVDVMNGKGYLSKTAKGDWTYDAITQKKNEDGTVRKVPFFARVAMLDHEYQKQMANSGASVSKVKQLFIKYFTNFWDKKLIEQPGDGITIPLRYLGKVGDNANRYSKDLMWQFLNFSENMTNKKHNDVMFSLGEAMALHLEKVNNEKEEKDKVTNLTKFIRAQAKYQATGQEHTKDVIKVARDTTDALFKVPIKIKNPYGGYDEYAWTLFSLLRGLKNYAAHTVMGLNFVGAAYNAFQAISSSVKTAASFTAGSYLLTGANKEVFDYQIGDVTKGYYEWMKMQETAINGDPTKTKLFLLARQMKYIPNTLEHFENKNSLTAIPWKIAKTSSLFFAHTSVEEMNAYSLLYAQLQIPVTATVTKPDGTTEKITKPFYEWYDVKEVEGDSTGKFKRYEAVWPENASRGKYYQGGEWKQAKGITAEESTRFKRVYERLQGNYRTEEKSFIEMYALGSVFMQFKRFLPSLIRGQFQSRNKDSSLGKFEVVQSDNGEDVLQWKERMITGKYRLLTDWIFKMALQKVPFMKDNKLLSIGEKIEWNELSLDEQVQLIDMLMSFGMWAMFSVAGAQAADDDGEKDSLAVMMDRLAQTSIQSWSLFQTISSVKNISPVGISILMNQITSISQMAGRIVKVGLGFEDSLYNEKGNLPGAALFRRNIPYMRSIEDIWRFKENYNSGDLKLGAR